MNPLQTRFAVLLGFVILLAQPMSVNCQQQSMMQADADMADSEKDFDRFKQAMDKDVARTRTEMNRVDDEFAKNRNQDDCISCTASTPSSGKLVHLKCDAFKKCAQRYDNKCVTSSGGGKECCCDSEDMCNEKWKGKDGLTARTSVVVWAVVLTNVGCAMMYSA